MEGESQGLLLEYLDKASDGGGVVGTVPIHHLEEHDTQRPDISLSGVGLTLDNFRSHIYGGTQHRVGNIVMVFEVFAETEVSHFYLTIVQENVVGFEVPVHDIVLVKDFEGLEQLSEELQRSLQWESRPIRVLLNVRAEGAPIAELIHEVVVVGGFQHVQVPNDMRRGLHVRKRLYLVDGAFLQLGYLFELGNFDNFDSHHLFGDHMDALVDLAVGALPNELL